MALLDIHNLKVDFRTNDGVVNAVKGIDFTLDRGETLAIVGESGSGKSQTAFATVGLLAQNGEVSGSAKYDGRELIGMPLAEMNKIRAREIAMIFQDPMTSLNPYMRISDQMAEVLQHHEGKSKKEALAEAVRLLDMVRIPAAKARLNMYPHEFSGGMRQRIMIAMALLCKPKLLIADEPTTALDVTVQAEVLDVMDDLKRETNTGIALITHDMGVVARMSDNIIVMRYGEVVERGTADQIFYEPQHDYTKMLLAAVPHLERTDRGERPSIDLAAGRGEDPILKVRDMKVHFPVQIDRKGLFRRTRPLRAVDGVSFDLQPGQTLGVVGESGCGKSTLARGVLQLIPPTSGEVVWLGRDVSGASRSELRDLREELQIVFQDPLASLDPRMTVGDSIAEPLKVHRPGLSRSERQQKVRQMLERVGLDSNMINRYPHEMSGGQNQRVGIARAMITEPKLVVCDEAVSALDVSVQARVVDLLIELQKSMGLAMIFISHDLSVVREVSHRIMVLYLGRVVELADGPEIYESPAHPYTRALLSAVPRPDPRAERSRERVRLEGDLPSPLDSRAQLRFMKSKLVDDPEADQYRPKLVEVSPGHYAAEHDPVLGTEALRAS
ncbi:ABC transporter ATP-binding protein [Pseudoroseicyclus tamaricis]|uniref:ABC transporter ATP-binding protein n=1 Tax=Pseudoroseicyclus tamaricis TaxID=2705421 RepID=A0A6B2JYS2_9RHOB|nr:ABC transporter ATP-binding protein [Pseudoroseicyclus tamaricis]NDV01759.1 ABC transporter ATP-binding protein [Pseudoroseicyclus tamaricis]